MFAIPSANLPWPVERPGEREVRGFPIPDPREFVEVAKFTHPLSQVLLEIGRLASHGKVDARLVHRLDALMVQSLHGNLLREIDNSGLLYSIKREVRQGDALSQERYRTIRQASQGLLNILGVNRSVDVSPQILRKHIHSVAPWHRQRGPISRGQLRNAIDFACDFPVVSRAAFAHFLHAEYSQQSVLQKTRAWAREALNPFA